MDYNDDYKAITISVGDVEMDCLTFGHGTRPLVILPGISVRPVVPLAMAVVAAYAHMTATHTVYLFDRSRPLSADADVATMTEDTVRVMQQMGLTDVDILGCSQGGMMAQHIAVTHPELVHRMVLASTMARISEPQKDTFVRWLALTEGGDSQALLADMDAGVYSEAYRRRYAKAFAAVEALPVEDEDLRRFAIMARACLTFNLYDRLPAVQCPTFVVGSWGDAVLLPDSSIELARRLQCPLYLYRGYGHAVYDEAPDFKERILRFLLEP